MAPSRSIRTQTGKPEFVINGPHGSCSFSRRSMLWEWEDDVIETLRKMNQEGSGTLEQALINFFNRTLPYLKEIEEKIVERFRSDAGEDYFDYVESSAPASPTVYEEAESDDVVVEEEKEDDEGLVDKVINAPPKNDVRTVATEAQCEEPTDAIPQSVPTAVTRPAQEKRSIPPAESPPAPPQSASRRPALENHTSVIPNTVTPRGRSAQPPAMSAVVSQKKAQSTTRPPAEMQSEVIPLSATTPVRSARPTSKSAKRVCPATSIEPGRDAVPNKIVTYTLSCKAFARRHTDEREEIEEMSFDEFRLQIISSSFVPYGPELAPSKPTRAYRYPRMPRTESSSSREADSRTPSPAPVLRKSRTASEGPPLRQARSEDVPPEEVATPPSQEAQPTPVPPPVIPPGVTSTQSVRPHTDPASASSIQLRQSEVIPPVQKILSEVVPPVEDANPSSKRIQEPTPVPPPVIPPLVSSALLRQSAACGVIPPEKEQEEQSQARSPIIPPSQRKQPTPVPSPVLPPSVSSALLRRSAPSGMAPPIQKVLPQVQTAVERLPTPETSFFPSPDPVPSPPAEKFSFKPFTIGRPTITTGTSPSLTRRPVISPALSTITPSVSSGRTSVPLPVPPPILPPTLAAKFTSTDHLSFTPQHFAPSLSTSCFSSNDQPTSSTASAPRGSDAETRKLLMTQLEKINEHIDYVNNIKGAARYDGLIDEILFVHLEPISVDGSPLTIDTFMGEWRRVKNMIRSLESFFHKQDSYSVHYLRVCTEKVRTEMDRIWSAMVPLMLKPKDTRETNAEKRKTDSFVFDEDQSRRPKRAKTTGFVMRTEEPSSSTGRRRADSEGDKLQPPLIASRPLQDSRQL